MRPCLGDANGAKPFRVLATVTQRTGITNSALPTARRVLRNTAHASRTALHAFTHCASVCTHTQHSAHSAHPAQPVATARGSDRTAEHSQWALPNGLPWLTQRSCSLASVIG
jgi:hypothetical protein